MNVNTSPSPLHLAAQCGHIDVVNLLLEHGAWIDVEDRLQWTPLHYAADEEQYRMCEHLIDKGANVNLINADGNYAYDLTNTSIMKLFIRRGFDLRDEYLKHYDGDYEDMIDMLIGTIDDFASSYQ